MASNADRILRLIIMGVDDFTPTMNRLNGSLTNTARITNSATGSMTKQTGLLNEQLRILRRTAEYAISGQAIYQVYKAVNAYKTFRSELGLLNANLQTSQKNLDSLGQSAIRVSTQTVTPIADVVQSYQNLAATFPGLSRGLYPKFAAVEARASRVMQVDPQAIGATIGQLATQFYGRQALNGPNGPNLIGRIGNELAYTLFTTPKTTGADITSYIPMLAGGARTAGFTLEQMLSLFAVSQRTLGRPAQTAQYLRQLMLRLRQPTKAEQPFFAQAGLTPTALSNMNGMQALQALIRTGLSLPGASMNYNQARTAGFRGLNISGQSAQFFQSAIGGRMQSLVALSSLVRNWGQVTVQQQNLVRNSTGYLDKAWGKWLDQNRMSQAANNFNNMTLSMLNDMNPLIQKASQVAAAIAGWGMGANSALQRGAGFLNKNVFGNIIGQNNANRLHLGGATEIAGIVGGIVGLRRLGLGGYLKGLPGVGRLFGRAGGANAMVDRVMGAAIRGPLDVQALSSALSGRANGTPGAPFWVVIHPLSATTVPGMFGKTKGGGSGSQSSTDKIVSKVLGKTVNIGEKTLGPLTAAEAGYRAGTGRSLTKAGLKAMARLALKRPGYDIEMAGRMFSRSAVERIALTGSADILGGPAMIAAGVLMSDGTVISHPVLGKNQTWANLGGGYYKPVRKNSLFDLAFNRHQLNITPAIARGEMLWGRGKMSAERLTQMLLTANPLIKAGYSQATLPVNGAQSLEATFWLQPTEELRSLLKPQKVRAHIGVPAAGKSPAPTTRARTTTRNG